LFNLTLRSFTRHGILFAQVSRMLFQKFLEVIN
jgi:hypothetical protein